MNNAVKNHHNPRFFQLPTLSSVFALMRINKQYGTLLVLLPALWSLFIASKGYPDPVLLMIIISGAFLIRSAGCAINDIADRNFDPYVERTKERPLASGKMTLAQAFFVFALLVALAGALTLYMNALAITLSACSLFFVILYPFTKRFVHFPQVFLGIAFGWGAIIVWAAVRNEVSLTAFLIFLATVTWSVAFDTIYAIVDIDDDVKVGVKSTAILFGRHVKQAVAFFFTATLLFTALAGLTAHLGFLFYISLSISAVFFILQTYSIRHDMDRVEAFRYFKANPLFAFIVLCGIIAHYRF